MRDALAERGKAGEDRQALLDDLLAIVADPTIEDEQIGGLIRGERIGWARIRAAMAQAVPRLPRDHGHLGALDASYGYLRQFTLQVLAAVRFAGGTAATDLLAAVEILRELNGTGARRVPDDAPAGFVPTRWRGYLRQGIVCYGGKAWTGAHDVWLRGQRFSPPGLQLAYDTAYDTVLAAAGSPGCGDRRG